MNMRFSQESPASVDLMRQSAEAFHVSQAGFESLAGELDMTAMSLGRLIETEADSPYDKYSWDSSAGTVEYQSPKNPSDLLHPRTVVIDKPSKTLGTQLMRVGAAGLFTPSRVEFTVAPPSEAHESGVPEVNGVVTSKFLHTQREVPLKYQNLHWALQAAGATVTPSVEGKAPSRSSSGH